MKPALGLGWALLFAVVGAPADDGKKPAGLDPVRLVGTWQVTEGVKAGEKSAADSLKGSVVVTRERITVRGERSTFVFAYTVNARAEPVEIEMEILEPQAFKGTKAKGIVAVDDAGVLRLCYHPRGGARPTTFASTEDDRNFLFTMKKQGK
jgi:uncharacterized protein (TIGR03067 family)